MPQAALISASLRAASPALHGPASALPSDDGVKTDARETFGQIFHAQADAASVSVMPGAIGNPSDSKAASLVKEPAAGESESEKAETTVEVGATDAGNDSGNGAKAGEVHPGFSVPPGAQEFLATARHAAGGSDISTAVRVEGLASADKTGASGAVRDESTGKSTKSRDTGKGDAGKSSDKEKSRAGETGLESAGTVPVPIQVSGLTLSPTAVASQAAAPAVTRVRTLAASASTRVTESGPRTMHAVPIPNSAQDALSAAGKQSGTVAESPEGLTTAPDSVSQKDTLAGKVPAPDGQSKVMASPVTISALPGAMSSGTAASQDGKAAPDAALPEARSVEAKAKTAGVAAQAIAQVGAQAGAQPGTGAAASLAFSPTLHSASNLTSNPAGMPVSGMAPASTSPYARMDQMGQGAAPVVLHSGAQQVAVGVQDASLGWVEIRTQNISGHVDATLVAASGASQSALAAQLPAMAQFVAQHDVRLGSLAVQQQAASNFGGGLSGGTGHGNGAGQNGTGQGGANPGNGFSAGGFMGGSGNPAGGSHSRSSHSGFSSGRSVGGIAAASTPAVPTFYENGEDAIPQPISYISVRV